MCAKKALINIDYTNDFVAADGRLTCGEPGRLIEENIVALTKSFLEDGEYVVFAIDCHHENDPYHPETSLFPPHNIEGTSGRALYGKLQALFEKYRGSDKVHAIDKTRYSAFCGTDLELRLRERGISELHLCGVCTDICVLHTAVDAYNKGFRLVIHENAVASFNARGHAWALDHFKHSLGAEVR
ncbi:cysteine hydrolase family protein [Heyndrickxia acidiproducens]|uniref:cysteine hydrolase family protein n=1 Tax=Heyndrickxia acidiproducens TaxID=1121084 RepID=UPI00036C0981|nr:isochorismatase family cysteine hydrolase [Heyndrickxia acidiproducens]